MKTRLLALFLVLIVWLWAAHWGETVSSTMAYPTIMTASQAEALDRFEVELEALRQQIKIPAMSAAIVKDQELIWAQGFGYADLRRKVPATSDTPYHLASLTKPFAAVIVMQLVEEGLLNLDDPVSDYGLNFSGPGVVRVRHLLTHTSEGVPGSEFNYNGNRFDLLTTVVEQVTGRTFRELLYERILNPLEMQDTATNPWGREGFWGSLGAVLRDGNTRRIYGRLAEPYRLDESYEIVHGGGYVESLGAAAGLIFTVEDMARFDIAMDQGRLVSPEVRERMFAPTISTQGRELPYGLGWFVQDYEGTHLIWHYGHWYCNSSLILKVPEEDLTLIVLANSADLSRPYKLGHKDTHVFNSPLALAFYETFVFAPRQGRAVPDVDWEAGEAELAGQLARTASDPAVAGLLERELWAYRMLFGSAGRIEQADRLLDVQAWVFPNSPLRHDRLLRAIVIAPQKAVYTPGLRHVLIALPLALVFASILVLWPLGYLAGRWRARRAGAPVAGRAGRRLFGLACVLAVLAAVLFVVIFFLAVAYYSSAPVPISWSGGSPLVKVLVALPWLHILLAAGLVLLAAWAWRRRAGPVGWRLHYTLIALAALACIYLWQQLALLG